MPTVTLNKKVFEKLVGKSLPLDKLKDRISMLGTDLEHIEGNEIKVEVFPNRPDMLSEQGFARAFSSFIGVKTGFRNYTVKDYKQKMHVKNLPKQWPYAVACIVKGLKLDEEKVREIIQLQEKLGTTLTRNRKKGGIGLYPLEKITFPITFTGKKPKDITFKPLGMKKDIKANDILALHSKGMEYGHIMKGWDTYPVFVDAKGTIMSMPPIINSDDVGKIDESTTDVFIEGTGPDMNTIKTSLAILATSLADMGGQVYSLDMVYGMETFAFPDLSARKLPISRAFVNKHLGLDLSEKDMKKYLERMGFGYEKGKVLVPAYRADILHEVDFAEDIAIAYGYENFDAVIPQVATIGRESENAKRQRRIGQILSGLGLLEVNTFNLSHEKVQSTLMNHKSTVVKLANSVSEDYSCLRSWIIPHLMEVFAANKHHEYPQNIFGMGRIFKHNKKTETGIEENDRVAITICSEKADYTAIRQVLDYLFRSIDKEYHIEEVEHGSFIPGRVGRVISGKRKVGYIGEINPQVLENFKLEMPIAACEINLTELFLH